MSTKPTTTTTTPTTTTTTYNVPELMTQHKTKSAVIRFLNSQGLKRGDIAKLLGIRYQHVRNVLIQPLKKGQ